MQERLPWVPGKGKTGLHNHGVTFWLPVAKLGPLPKTPNNRAIPRIPPDLLASPLPLNPEVHRPQEGLCPQYSAAYLTQYLGSCWRSPGMFGGSFSAPLPLPVLAPACPAGIWSGSMGGGREDSLCSLKSQNRVSHLLKSPQEPETSTLSLASRAEGDGLPLWSSSGVNAWWRVTFA